MNFCKDCKHFVVSFQYNGENNCAVSCRDLVDLVTGDPYKVYSTCDDKRQKPGYERTEDCLDFVRDTDRIENKIRKEATGEAVAVTKAVMECAFCDLDWWERLRYPARKRK